VGWGVDVELGTSRFYIYLQWACGRKRGLANLCALVPQNYRIRKERVEDVEGSYEFYNNRMSVTLCNFITEASQMGLIQGYRHTNIYVFMCNITVIFFILHCKLIFCCVTITQLLAR
jgi:hypothetical protein